MGSGVTAGPGAGADDGNHDGGWRRRDPAVTPPCINYSKTLTVYYSNHLLWLQ